MNGAEKDFKFEKICQDPLTLKNVKIIPKTKELLYNYGITVSSRTNNMDDFPNQDDYMLYLTANYKLYGVFDGHGPYGD